VNEALVRRFYPDTDPIGRRVAVAGNDPNGEPNWQTFVGVVADVKQQGIEAPTGTEVFIPLSQSEAIYGGTPQTLYVALRGDLAAPALMATLRRAVTDLDATVPVYRLASMEEVMYEAVGKPRFITFLLVIFAVLALALATIGIYGVMSYSVAQRTRELGIRMALGAQAGRVRRMVLGEGLILAALGVGLGLVGALALNTGLAAQLAGLLFGVRPVEPFTFGVVAIVVLAVAALACFLPALRATRVDPMVALRHD
jgi:putative ABC transport system permease protein